MHKKFESNKVKTALIILIAFFTALPFFIIIIPNSGIKELLTKISNLWTGLMLYSIIILTIFFLIISLLKLLLKDKVITVYNNKTFFITASICGIVILVINILGNLNAKNIQTTNYTIQVDKSCNNIQNLNIMLIADLHLGYSINEKNIEQMVQKSNKCNPDIIIIAGDIFDNNFDAIKNPEKIIEQLKKLNSKYGVYACFGNHDISEKAILGFTFDNLTTKNTDDRMISFLNNSNIKLLNDEYTLIDDSFYIYGRPDFYKDRFITDKRKNPNEITESLDKSKPIILIDHEPKQLQKLADAGVDVVLGGHTHDGQFFPANLLIKFAFKNPCGLLKKNNMYSIVTSGVGIYGPYIRVGTKAEICNIQVNFQNN